MSPCFLIISIIKQRSLFLPAGHCHGVRLPAGAQDGDDGGALEAEDAGGVQLVYQPRAAMLFQVHQFLLRNAGSVVERTVRAAGHIPSGRDFFFTFQSLSYTIDVYRRDLKPLSSLLDYAFYVSFFPQLVAGPIVRARDFIPQIRRPLSVTSEMFGQGIFFIVSGLFKKAVISDYISVNFVERIFDNPGLYSGLETCLGFTDMPCRYTVTFRATVTWLSDLPCCWDSISLPTLIRLIRRTV